MRRLRKILLILAPTLALSLTGWLALSWEDSLVKKSDLATMCLSAAQAKEKYVTREEQGLVIGRIDALEHKIDAVHDEVVEVRKDIRMILIGINSMRGLPLNEDRFAGDRLPPKPPKDKPKYVINGDGE